MFDIHNSPIVNFSEREKFNEQLAELRRIVINLEFRREEMNAGLDRLTQTLNSFDLIDSQRVNK